MKIVLGKNPFSPFGIIHGGVPLPPPPPVRLVSHGGLSDSDIITSEGFGRPGRHQLLSSNTKLVRGSQPNALIQLLTTCSFPCIGRPVAAGPSRLLARRNIVTTQDFCL